MQRSVALEKWTVLESRFGCLGEMDYLGEQVLGYFICLRFLPFLKLVLLQAPTTNLQEIPSLMLATLDQELVGFEPNLAPYLLPLSSIPRQQSFGVDKQHL